MPKTLNNTKHFQLANRLRQQIRRKPAGTALPTVTELKQRYNVSQATVERALDRLRKEGLVLRPPGHLRLIVAEVCDVATHRVAIIRPDYPSPTFEALARSIVQAGKKQNWAFETLSYRAMENLDFTRAVGEHDAAILLPTSEPFPQHLMTALRKPRVPVLVIQDPPAGLSVGSVQIDDRQVGQLAVEHLVALGHERILLLLSEPTSPSGVGRAQGWREAMQAKGLDHLDELVVDAQVHPFEASLQSTYEYFRKWLARPHPDFTAIFCPCWTGAMAAMRALREAGISIPDQVSVIGHGGEDRIGGFLNPPLTAIETDFAVYGRAVIKLLFEQLNTENTSPQSITIPSELVVRGSTGPARKNGRP